MEEILDTVKNVIIKNWDTDYVTVTSAKDDYFVKWEILIKSEHQSSGILVVIATFSVGNTNMLYLPTKKELEEVVDIHISFPYC